MSLKEGCRPKVTQGARSAQQHTRGNGIPPPAPTRDRRWALAGISTGGLGASGGAGGGAFLLGRACFKEEFRVRSRGDPMNNTSTMQKCGH